MNAPLMNFTILLVVMGFYKGLLIPNHQQLLLFFYFMICKPHLCVCHLLLSEIFLQLTIQAYYIY